MRLVDRHQRNTLGVGKINKRFFCQQFLGHTVALQFDIEAIAKNIEQTINNPFCLIGDALDQSLIDSPGRAARQGNQTLTVSSEQAQGYLRVLCCISFQIGATGQMHQIHKTVFIFGNQRQQANTGSVVIAIALLLTGFIKGNA